MKLFERLLKTARLPGLIFRRNEAPSSEYYNNYNVDQLREQARERGLSPAGTKRTLATRLAFNDMQQQPQQQQPQKQSQKQPQQQPGKRSPDATVNYPEKQQHLKLKRVSVTYEPLSRPKNWIQKRRK